MSVDSDGTHDREPDFKRLYDAVFATFYQKDTTATVATRRLYAAGVRVTHQPAPAPVEPDQVPVPMFDIEEDE